MNTRHITEHADGYRIEGYSHDLVFNTCRDAIEYMTAMDATALPVLDCHHVEIKGWTPARFHYGGSSRMTTYNALFEAAAAVARAEELVRQTYPHPRDGGVDARRPAYLAALQQIEGLFELLQRQASRVIDAPGIE